MKSGNPEEARQAEKNIQSSIRESMNRIRTQIIDARSKMEKAKKPYLEELAVNKRAHERLDAEQVRLELAIRHADAESRRCCCYHCMDCISRCSDSETASYVRSLISTFFLLVCFGLLFTSSIFLFNCETPFSVLPLTVTCSFLTLFILSFAIFFLSCGQRADIHRKITAGASLALFHSTLIILFIPAISHKYIIFKKFTSSYSPSIGDDECTDLYAFHFIFVMVVMILLLSSHFLFLHASDSFEILVCSHLFLYFLYPFLCSSSTQQTIQGGLSLTLSFVGISLFAEGIYLETPYLQYIGIALSVVFILACVDLSYGWG